MADLGICFYCLTDGDRQEPAVTTHRGTALCAPCAKTWNAEIRQAESEADAYQVEVDQRLERLRNFNRNPRL